ncbi:hypothetical protein [Armatimonas rosea]|uniref:Uncharacterized protein n=1 Tax=Armatimonas rosea TaxID=685828 RepID=A0A7W9SVI7_ARMRO|nr:hypothetical protein [Armatimonas rosea]MBB6053125.1 hypothetical protein [Armatimonas rosea]
MKYKRCCACDYFVTTTDRRCPNCGIADPRNERPDRGIPEIVAQGDTLTMETPMTDGVRAAFGGFIGAVIGGFLMAGMGVAVGLAVGISLGVLLGADKEWSPPELTNLAKRMIECLRNDEETIRQRLNDIAQREKHLEETRQQVAVSGGDAATQERWNKVRQTIDSAAGVLAKQRDRYHAKLWEIALVRWQNALEPLASDWESLTHEACNQRLRQLERLRDQGKQYLDDWEGVDLTDLPEARRCLERLRNALESCDQLREALIVEQARLAVVGIAPVDEALSTSMSTSSTALHALDVFNARAALGEFESAFDDLEAEYNRLRSEDELAQQVTLVQRR